MPEISDERPSKRPRRYSRSPPTPEDLDTRRSFGDRSHRNQSPDASERRRWGRSRERAYDVERSYTKRSPSKDGTTKAEPRESRRYRGRSQDRDSHRSSRPHRSRRQPESSESDRDNDYSKNRGDGRDRRRDFNSDKKADRDQDYSRRRNHRREERRSRDRSDENEDRDRGRDRDKDKYRKRDRNRSKDQDRRRRSASPKPYQRLKGPLPSQNDAFLAESNPDAALDKPVEKQKPNFGLTGKLAAASNTVQTANQSIVLKYHEPPEARKPSARDRWRLYIFKDEEILDTVELAEQSCWLFGREVAVADIPLEHASCSKQHSVIQFRYIEKRNEFGDKIGKVKPYVIDLESANGTTVNKDPVPAAKYVELIDKDVIRFGHSSREYVMQLPPPG